MIPFSKKTRKTPSDKKSKPAIEMLIITDNNDIASTLLLRDLMKKMRPPKQKNGTINSKGMLPILPPTIVIVLSKHMVSL